MECSLFAKESNYFGSSSSAASSVPFTVSLLSLYQITVFSGDHLVAFQFDFLNGSSATFGNPRNGLVTQIYTIDLSKFNIVGINLSYGVYINSMQFNLTDKASNNTLVTSLFGSLIGTQISINQANFAPVGYTFFIDTFNGAADNFSVSLFSVNYNYKECSLQPRDVLRSKSSTTTSPGQCSIYNKVSGIFGNTSASSVPFTVSVTNVYEILIYSCETIIAFQFFYYNGSTEVFGNPNNSYVSHIDKINLRDHSIVGVNLNYDEVINSIQFLLMCKTTKSTKLTSIFGIAKGTSVSINMKNSAPSASSFSIDTLCGSTDNLYLTTFSVKYNYKQCNQ